MDRCIEHSFETKLFGICEPINRLFRQPKKTLKLKAMKTKMAMKTCLFLANIYLFNNVFAQTPPLVFDVENRTPSGTCNTAAGNTSTTLSSLPDPFTFTTGGRVATFDEWTCRRNQIKSDIENYEIGPKQPKPASVTATYSGGRLTVTSTVNGQTLTQTANVTVPTGSGPFPVVIGMNSGTGSLGTNLFTGCIQINFAHDQVVTYANGSGSISSSDPYFKLYPSTTIGKYSAWSWGISRLIDGIEIVKAQMNADTKRIAVTGCSYAGKMALFGGAFDERIALTIAQESGGGGINSWRMSQAYTTRTGVNIEKIDNTNYSWFKSSMRNLNPNTLPHDHHELVAMIAPRAFLALGNPTQEWLGDESGYKSLMAAVEVWKAMGVEDRFGFDFTPDHSHCAASSSQNTAVTAFVNKFLKNTTANTTIRVNPTKITQQNITINSSVFNWTTPTLTFAPSDPNVPVATLTSPSASSNLEAPASIQLAASVIDADNNVTKVEFFNGTNKLGEDASVPYTFSLTDLEAGTYTFTAKATDATSKTGTSAAVTLIVKGPSPKIYKVSTPPVIDGTVDAIWNNASVLPMNATKTLTGTVTNANDLSGDAKVLWDNTYIYLLATVTDDTKKNDSPNAYEDDAVEFYFDANNDKATAYATGDVQYTFGWNDGTVVGVLPSGRSTTGITYSSVTTTTGYIIEARIPWTTIPATPTVGQEIGFDFMINDDDDASAGRDAKISWNSETDMAYQDPSLFGTVKFDDALITGGEDENLGASLSEITCYPNPFTNNLTVNAVGEFEYVLQSMSGETLYTGTSQNEIQLGKDLSQGIYFLKIKQSGVSKVVKVCKN